MPHAPEVVDSQMVLEIQAFCSKLIVSKIVTKNLYKDLRISLSKFRKDEHIIAKMTLDILDFYTISGLIEPTNVVEIISGIKEIIPFLTLDTELFPYHS